MKRKRVRLSLARAMLISGKFGRISSYVFDRELVSKSVK